VKFWDFQARAIRMAQRAISEGESPLVVSPPGSGKTYMIAGLARWAARRGRRVLVFSHRREIVEQTERHIENIGLKDIAIDMPGWPRSRRRHAIRIASVQTLSLSKSRPGADLVIVDEAHRMGADSYAELRSHYHKADWAGFTATPFRLDGKGMDDSFTTLQVAATPSELIAKRLLAKPRLFVADSEFLPDMSDVRRIGGDYSAKVSSRRMRAPSLAGNVVDNYKRWADGKSGLVYAVNIEHAHDLAGRFNAARVPALVVHGNTPRTKRKAALASLGKECRLLVSCALLNEGYDPPVCDVVILARPTMSLSLYLQQAGRGMRVQGGRRPIILDHAGNSNRHGMPEADRSWSLTEGFLDDGQKGPLVRTCPECFHAVPIAAKYCPECRVELIQPRVIPPETPDALQEMTSKSRKSLAKRLREHLLSKGERDEIWVAKVVEAWTARRSA